MRKPDSIRISLSPCRKSADLLIRKAGGRIPHGNHRRAQFAILGEKNKPWNADIELINYIKSVVSTFTFYSFKICPDIGFYFTSNFNFNDVLTIF